MSSMASENFNGSRISRPGCSGSDDGIKSSPNRRRGSGSGTSPISHETAGSLLDHRQQDRARLIGRAEHGLGRFHVIRRLRKENIRNVGLRVPVVQRKPTGLDLDHNSMPWQKNVIGGRQGEMILLGLAGRNGRRMLEALAIAAPKNIHRN